jgi:hypothetical protein
MPTSLHPQAKFDPIPPDLDLYGLVDKTPNFKWVQRVSRNQIRSLGQQEFEKLVLIHVIIGGKPLVIDGWEAALSQGLFDVGWLEKTHDKTRMLYLVPTLLQVLILFLQRRTCEISAPEPTYP